MTVTCPTCSLQGVVDAVSTAATAQVVCARCETAYEVRFAGPRAENAPGANVAASDAKAVGAPSSARSREDENDVLAIPEYADEPSEADRHALVLEDVFSPEELNGLDAGAFTDTGTAPSESAAAEAEADLPDVEAQGIETSGLPSWAKSDALNYDKYAVGVKLLRVSPVWLLLSGLAFASVIACVSWMSSPGEQIPTQVVASARQNQATNQSRGPDAQQQVERASEAREGEAFQADVAEATRPVEASVKNEKAEAAPALAPASRAPATPQPETKPSAAPQGAVKTEAGGNFTVQVGSYPSQSDANERVSKLRAAGFEAQVVAAELPGKGTWYRVRTGRFHAREEASHHGAKLRATGAIESFIVTEVGK